MNRRRGLLIIGILAALWPMAHSHAVGRTGNSRIGILGIYETDVPFVDGFNQVEETSSASVKMTNPRIRVSSPMDTGPTELLSITAQDIGRIYTPAEEARHDRLAFERAFLSRQSGGIWDDIALPDQPCVIARIFSTGDFVNVVAAWGGGPQDGLLLAGRDFKATRDAAATILLGLKLDPAACQWSDSP